MGPSTKIVPIRLSWDTNQLPAKPLPTSGKSVRFWPNHSGFSTVLAPAYVHPSQKQNFPEQLEIEDSQVLKGHRRVYSERSGPQSIGSPSGMASLQLLHRSVAQKLHENSQFDSQVTVSQPRIFDSELQNSNHIRKISAPLQKRLSSTQDTISESKILSHRSNSPAIQSIELSQRDSNFEKNRQASNSSVQNDPDMAAKQAMRDYFGSVLTSLPINDHSHSIILNSPKESSKVTILDVDKPKFSNGDKKSDFTVFLKAQVLETKKDLSSVKSSIEAFQYKIKDLESQINSKKEQLFQFRKKEINSAYYSLQKGNISFKIDQTSKRNSQNTLALQEKFANMMRDNELKGAKALQLMIVKELVNKERRWKNPQITSLLERINHLLQNNKK